MVVGVPMTPILVPPCAAAAPASMTSSTGTGDSALTTSAATAAMVLQAMTRSLTSFSSRNARSAR
jgi:hypothetical protein